MLRDTPWPRRAAVVLSVLLLGSCAPGNLLRQYDFSGGTLAVVSDIPRRPDILSGPYFLGRPSGDPIRDAVRTGARIYREVEARAVRERLDSAAARIDVGHVLEDATLERAARYLGARPVEDPADADYLLELTVFEYGIDAEAWDAAAHFYIEADAALIHAASGEEIWRREVDAQDAIGTAVFGPARAVRDVVTAASLADLEIEEMVLALESLADFSGRVVTNDLRDDLREARRNR